MNKRTLSLGALLASAAFTVAFTPFFDLIELLSPPADVQEGALTSDTEIPGFQEADCFELPNDLEVDIDAAGLFDDEADLTGGTILGGTEVICTFVHMDAETPPVTLFGAMLADDPVLGIIVTDDLLDASDPVTVCGNASTLYPTGEPGRGLELDDGDRLQFNGGQALRFQLNDPDNDFDQLRVITECGNGR